MDVSRVGQSVDKLELAEVLRMIPVICSYPTCEGCRDMQRVAVDGDVRDHSALPDSDSWHGGRDTAGNQDLGATARSVANQCRVSNVIAVFSQDLAIAIAGTIIRVLAVSGTPR